MGLSQRTCLDVTEAERRLGRVNVGLQQWKRQMAGLSYSKTGHT